MVCSSPSALERLARVCSRHPWRTLASWMALLVPAVFLIATFIGSALTTQGSMTNDPESMQADALLQDRLRGPARVTELVVVRSPALTVDDPRFAEHVQGLYGRIMALGDSVVEAGYAYTMAPDASLVSTDRHATVMPSCSRAATTRPTPT